MELVTFSGCDDDLRCKLRIDILHVQENENWKGSENFEYNGRTFKHERFFYKGIHTSLFHLIMKVQDKDFALRYTTNEDMIKNFRSRHEYYGRKTWGENYDKNIKGNLKIPFQFN